MGLEVEGRTGRPEVLSLQRGKEHELWSHLDGICEHGERGGQHQSQLSTKSIDVSGFPGNVCCSKKKKSYRAVPFKLVQYNFSIVFYRDE